MHRLRPALLALLLASPLVHATHEPHSGLLDIHQRALASNAGLAAARAAMLARQEAVPQARAGLLPQLNGAASLSDGRTTLDSPPLTRERSSLVWQASLSQPLLRLDRWHGLQAAEIQSEQARIEYAATEQALVLQTAEAYFSTLRARDALAASRAEEAAYRQQLEQAQGRFELGVVARTDVLEAQAAFDGAHAARLGAERAVEDAFGQLMVLTNHPYQQLEGLRHSMPVLPPQPADAAAWVERTGSTNLYLQASQLGVQAAGESLRQRKAGHAPSLDLVASYQQGDNDAFGLSNSSLSPLGYGSPVSSRSIGLQLNVPLYSGGLTRSQVRQGWQQLQQSEYSSEDLRRQLLQETRNLHRAVHTDVAQVQARRQAIASSRLALQATEAGYQVGTRNLVDVLNAQRQLYSSVRDYNDARYAWILDSLRLKQVAGSLGVDDLRALSAHLDPGYDPDRDFLPPPP